jgi:hypothetical protein
MGKIKEIKLSEVASQINVDFSNQKIEITLNKESMKDLYMNANKVAEGLDKKHIKAKVASDDRLLIKPKDEFDYFSHQNYNIFIDRLNCFSSFSCQKLKSTPSIWIVSSKDYFLLISH